MKIVSYRLPLAMQLLIVFAGAAVLMFFYEFLKEAFFNGSLTGWNSHAMTIVVTATCAAVAAVRPRAIWH